MNADHSGNIIADILHQCDVRSAYFTDLLACAQGFLVGYGAAILTQANSGRGLQLWWSILFLIIAIYIIKEK